MDKDIEDFRSMTKEMLDASRNAEEKKKFRDEQYEEIQQYTEITLQMT